LNAVFGLGHVSSTAGKWPRRTAVPSTSERGAPDANDRSVMRSGPSLRTSTHATSALPSGTLDRTARLASCSEPGLSGRMAHSELPTAITTPAMTSRGLTAPTIRVFHGRDQRLATADAPAGSRDRGVMSTTLKTAAEEFLAHKRIAVAGVSRDENQPANLIYRRLRDTGHEVFAVNPAAGEVEGDQCYASVSAIPDGVDGVVVVTPAEASAGVVEDCHAAGVPRVWLHRGLGPGSLSADAVARCYEHGIDVIPGGCPNMFGATSDIGHRCLCGLLQLTHKIPRQL
jgi:predicted CoA-binding protein